MINAETKKFILENVDKDANYLALHPSKGSLVDMQIALQQIEGKQKAKIKLPEFYFNDDILYPKRVSMEQCSSEQTAKYKASLVSGVSFADLSGGFGVDTVYFSKKFEKGTYLEPNQQLCDIFVHNSKVLNIDNVSIINSDLESFIDSLDYVDLIYIDPSRRDKFGNRKIIIDDLTPNILDYKEKLMAKCNTMLIKLSPMLDISELVRAFPEMNSLHIISINNECKELLCILSKVQHTDIEIVAANITNTKTYIFSEYLSVEKSEKPQIASQIGQYLYEPNSSIMKSGLYNSVAKSFNINKIATNSNLYTSDELIEIFPGRIFKVADVLPFNQKNIKKQLNYIESASIAVRNFPISAQELRKIVNIKDGNQYYIFGTTDADNKKILVLSEKI